MLSICCEINILFSVETLVLINCAVLFCRNDNRIEFRGVNDLDLVILQYADGSHNLGALCSASFAELCGRI